MAIALSKVRFWGKADIDRHVFCHFIGPAEFRIAEKSYGADHLDLVLSNGYVGKLLGNARVVRYLAQHHHDILTEFQKLAENETAAA